MAYFFGEYEVAMDAKGRFLLPSGFRKQLAEGTVMSFVLSRGLEQCVTLYTLEGWEKVTEKIQKLNSLKPQVQRFMRLFLNGATIIEMDSAGRLLIPKSLQEHAQLKKELIFQAGFDKVEIWDKQLFQSYMDSNADDFANLADELMGGDN